MPGLDHILPAADHPTAGDSEATMLSLADPANAEPFAQVMSRALSPRGAHVPAAPNRRGQTNGPGPQKRCSADAKSAPAQDSIPLASSAAEPDSSVSVKTKDGRPQGDAAGKDANPPEPCGAAGNSDVSPHDSVFLLAPTLAACLLQPLISGAPPQSDASNPSAAAALPAGADGKSDVAAAATVPGTGTTVKPSVADLVLQLAAEAPPETVPLKAALASSAPAQTTSVEITAGAAAAPIISDPAGTDHAQPRKDGAISANDVLPGVSGQLAVGQNSAAESALFTPVKPHGTSVAKQDVPMKNSEQTNNIAGLVGAGEKVLPGDTVPGARANILSVRGGSLSVQARVEPAEGNAAPALAPQTSAVPSGKPAVEVSVMANVSNLRSQALDRTHDLVMQQTLRLVEAKSDSLRVVLMPEAGTKLSLELRQRGDGVEVQAMLQSGDWENLKQHWPELQERLELRGIKLGPLSNEGNQGNSTLWSGHQGSKHQPEPLAERESLLSAELAGFAPVSVRNNLPAEPAIPAGLVRGWQMWA